MNQGFPFVTADVFRRVLRRPGSLLLWAGVVAAVLLSGTALFLIPVGPNSPAQRKMDAYLLARLSPLLSEADIARLGSEVGAWPGVAMVTFRFPGESDPIPITTRSLLVRLASPEGQATVERRLGALSGVVGVEFVQKAAAPTRIPPVSRIAALVALVGTLGLCVWLGHRASAQAVRAWGSELGLLRTCGWSEGSLKIPFLLLGAVVGLLGGALFVAACWALWAWGPGISFLQDMVPHFPRVWPGLVGIGGLTGVGLGLVGAILGTLDLPDHS